MTKLQAAERFFPVNEVRLMAGPEARDHPSARVFYDYWYGRPLTGVEQKEMERHLCSCALCKGRLAQYERLYPNREHEPAHSNFCPGELQ